MSTVTKNRAQVRSSQPDRRLVPYPFGIYLNDVEVAPGARMADMLHPEWANLRFMEGDPSAACIGPGDMLPTPACVLAGPTSYGTRFETGTFRSWGIGFLPLGWTKFVHTSAELYAEQDPTFKSFVELRPLVGDPSGDPHAQAQAINRHLLELLADARPN